MKSCGQQKNSGSWLPVLEYVCKAKKSGTSETLVETTNENLQWIISLGNLILTRSRHLTMRCANNNKKCRTMQSPIFLYCID